MARREPNLWLCGYFRLACILIGVLSVGAYAVPLEAAPALQSSFIYNCYSPGQACSGNTGDTRGGGHGAQSCSPISAVGCSQYSYNGGGQFKLCQYSDADCGTIVESGPNGGAVTCVVFPGTRPRSWKVVIHDQAC
ncbi:hypothetical protein VF21_08723 [Pseudogymnoascus sp. 05NY08]|nr:hypothetical protein VF21_08723 [Pseudogymnoascus sp. 05NY08]